MRMCVIPYTGLFIALFGEAWCIANALFGKDLFSGIVLVYTWLARGEEQPSTEGSSGDAIRNLRAA